MVHKVVTGVCRLVYVRGLKEKSAPPGSDRLRFNVNVVIDKDDSYTLRQLEEAFDNAKKEGREKLWANKAPVSLKFENFIRDRSEENDHEIWENSYAIVPKTDYDVKVIDHNKEPVSVDKCYDGMNARVSITLYPYKHETGGKGIGIFLNGIQMLPGGDEIEIVYDISKDFDDDYESDYNTTDNKEPEPEEKTERKKRRRRR
jgi:hypothetical protein